RERKDNAETPRPGSGQAPSAEERREGIWSAAALLPLFCRAEGKSAICVCQSRERRKRGSKSPHSQKHGLKFVLPRRDKPAATVTCGRSARSRPFGAPFPRGQSRRRSGYPGCG